MAPVSSCAGPVIILAHDLARAIGKAGNRRSSSTAAANSPPVSMPPQIAVTSAWARPFRYRDERKQRLPPNMLG